MRLCITEILMELKEIEAKETLSEIGHEKLSSIIDNMEEYVRAVEYAYMASSRTSCELV